MSNCAGSHFHLLVIYKLSAIVFPFINSKCLNMSAISPYILSLITTNMPHQNGLYSDD